MTDNPYWQILREYAIEEVASGGPDAHVAIIGTHLKQTFPEPSWQAVYRAGMYANAYTCAGGALLWARTRVGPVNVEWLREAKVPKRKERRPVLGHDKFAACHVSWRRWAKDVWPGLFMTGATYDQYWDSIDSEVQYFGRYASMKVLEVMYRAGLTGSACQPDTRPRGGKFQRRTLAKLFPEHAEWLKFYEKKDSPLIIGNVMTLADEVMVQMREYLPNITWFDVETFLCTLRQAIGSGKYPGRTHDSELAFWYGAGARHGFNNLDQELPFFDLRKELFEHRFLAELHKPSWSMEERENEWKAKMDRALAY